MRFLVQSCWCSGVTDRCSEAQLFWSTLRFHPNGPDHGVKVTDRLELLKASLTKTCNTLPTISLRRTRRRFFGSPSDLWRGDGLVTLDASSSTSSANDVLYFLLPEQFLGNKAESYGGNLTLTQSASYVVGGEQGLVSDPDVVIVGNGVSLHWTDPDGGAKWTVAAGRDNVST